MKKLGVFFTCFNEIKAVEYSIKILNENYPSIPIYLVSEGLDFSYLASQYDNLFFSQEEDTMSVTFQITDKNFREEVHQTNMKKAALSVIDRLIKCIEWCKTDYILMMDPDALVRGKLNIPENCKLLGSKINKGFPQEYREVLSSIPGACVINDWGATPAIFDSTSFLKASIFLKENLDRLCKTFYALYAHDVLLPTLFALIGEQETFNPDIIECNRDPDWESKCNPLVHQFKRYYPSRQ